LEFRKHFVSQLVKKISLLYFLDKARNSAYLSKCS
jgi:hypothetical protein